MFKKCLKYDLKNMLSIWWIGALTVIITAIPAGFAIRGVDDADTYYGTFLSLWIFFAYLVLIAFGVFTEALIYLRYYNNFFKDEGYLTFTLPVKRSTLVLSKLVSATILNALSVAAVTAAVAFIMLVQPTKESNLLVELVNGFSQIIKELYENAGGWATVYLAEVALMMICGTIVAVITGYLFITIGATLVKRYKLVAIIAVFYVGNTVASILSMPALLLGSGWVAAMEQIVSVETAMGVLALSLLAVIAAMVTAGIFMLNAVMGTLERKLNLP